MKLVEELALHTWEDLDSEEKGHLLELNLVPDSWRFADRPEFFDRNYEFCSRGYLDNYDLSRYDYHDCEPPDLDETLPVHPASISKKGKRRRRRGPKTSAVEISRWLKIHCFPNLPTTFSILAGEGGFRWDRPVPRDRVKDALFSAIRQKRVDPNDFHKFLLWDSWKDPGWTDQSVAVKSYFAAREMAMGEVEVPPRLRWVFQRTAVRRAIWASAFHKRAGEAFLELAYEDGDAIRAWLQHAYAPGLLDLLDGFLLAHQRLFPLPGRIDNGGGEAAPEESLKVYQLMRTSDSDRKGFRTRYEL